MPRFRRSYILPVLILFLGLFSVACSVEKNTAATRSFHNLTSRYNIYFNATESFQKGILRAQESYKDDFTSLLPLFYYEDEATQQSISPQMKRAIDKCTKVITFHSITAKPQVDGGKQSEKDQEFFDKSEYNKWVDDSYLLIGKSYMYQGEFFMALETFKHVIANFSTEESYYLGAAWLIRVYNTLERFDESEKILISLQDEEFPKKHVRELYLSQTDYYLHREDFAEAANYLEKVLETRPKKTQRIRYHFILAQLYQKIGDGDASIANYRKVVRLNPPYVMAFNAKVNMAEAFQTGQNNPDEIKKLLQKMLKDAKNKEYQDQIYFALGNIAMQEGDRSQAIEYYHLSVSTSVQNNFQKGESCLTLAEIYYDQPEYKLSAAYYDTAVTMLREDYPNYNTLKLRSGSLNNLVRNVNAFELQDSLQVLAAMSEPERLSVVDGIISDLIAAEEEERRRKQEEMQDMMYNRSTMTGMNQGSGMGNQPGQQGAEWYFYSLNQKSFGQPEFRMKWGERKLEDNWRRSNKQSLASMMDEAGITQNEQGEAVQVAQILDAKSREFYLKDIPLTDSALQRSHKILEESLFNAGKIYSEELLDYDKAIETFTEQVERYPDGLFAAQAYYNLYDLHNSLRQNDIANRYKALLDRKFPESHLSKLLNNPNYLAELQAEEDKKEAFYVSVYDHYINENYSRVVRMAEQGHELYIEDDDLNARLAFLKAMSLGGMQGKQAMKQGLDSLVAHYPNSEQAIEAKEIIAYMYVAFPEVKQAAQVQEAEEIYTYEPDAPHRFVIALRKNENLNLVNFNLLNYNLDNFNTYDLRIVMTELDVDYNLLHVEGFTNLEGVRRYAEKVKADISQIMGELPQDAYEVLLISEDNFAKLVEEKEFTPYLLFHRQNYSAE